MTCPNCGGPLAPVVLGPDSPPWLCSVCARGWFVAELAGPAGSWDVTTRFHTYTAWPGMATACGAELVLAEDRGTSLLAAQIPTVGIRALSALLVRLEASPGAGAAAFAALVQAAINGRGVA